MARLTVVLIIAAGSGALAEARELSERAGPWVAFETTAVSRFLWRGFVILDSPSLQPSIAAGYGGLSVNVWGNFSRRVPHNQAWTEIDLTVEYSRQMGRWTLTGGFTDYRFVDTPAFRGNSSLDVFAGCALEGFLEPELRIYRDLEMGQGYYYSLFVNKTFRLPRSIRATTRLGIGLNQHQWVEQTTISNVESTTSFEVFRTERVLVAPFVTVMAGHRGLFGTHAAFGVRAVWER